VHDYHGIMKSEDVVEILQLLEGHGIEVIVDGGWGVDALLGEQTREHSDLDIAIQHRHVPELRRLLGERGYAEIQVPDTRDCNFVLVDARGRRVDVHSFTFDDKGNNVFGVAYKREHLTGAGRIGGRPVKCVPPDHMVAFHSGYELDENDYRDVKAICERFGIALPKEYERFIGTQGSGVSG
jgi:lincosamide nucleotidyltransferase A/C/D/E